MNWLSRLSGRKQSISMAEIADILAGSAIRSAEQLHFQLDEIVSAFRWGAAGLRNPEILLECLVFEWFVNDSTVVREFPRHSKVVCPMIASQLLDHLQPHRHRLEELRQSRSVDYIVAQAAGVDMLCGIAARRILAGDVDPFPDTLRTPHQMVAGLLSSRIAIRSDQFKEMGGRVEIV